MIEVPVLPTDNETTPPTEEQAIKTAINDMLTQLNPSIVRSPHVLFAILENFLEPCINSNQEATQRHLQDLLFTLGTEGEVLAQTILLYQGKNLSLKIFDKKANSNNFEYYGKQVSIDGALSDHSGSITELTIGVLVVYDQDALPIGFVNVHPDSVSWKEHSITTPLIPLTAFSKLAVLDFEPEHQELKQFLTEYKDNFDFANNSLYFQLCQKFGYGQNSNWMPIGTQFFLWKNLRFQSENSRIIHECITVFGRDIVWLAPIMKYDLQKLHNLKEATELSSLVSPQETYTFIATMINQHTFLVEHAHIASIKKPTGNEQIPRAEAEVIISEIFTKILSEFSDSVFNTGNDTLDIQRLLQHLLQAADSIILITRSLALFAAEKQIKFPFDQDEQDHILHDAATFPQAKTATLLRNLEWLVRALLNQSDDSQQAAQQWLADFYTHITKTEQDDVNVYETGANAYTEHEKVIPIVANAIAKLDLPDHYQALLIGSGPAHIERAIFDKATQKNPHHKPGKITAIDILEQPEESRAPGIEFHHGDAASLPFSNESIDLMLAVGSPFNNMRKLSVWIEYFQQIAQKLKQNGYFIYEVGSLVPAREINSRLRATQNFHQHDTTNPFGVIGILTEYLKEGDQPTDIGAILFEHPLFDLMASLMGLELISPPADPVEFAKMQEQLQNPQLLASIPAEDHNPLEQPFFSVNNNPADTRAVYIFRKTKPTHPLFDLFVRKFIRV